MMFVILFCSESSLLVHDGVQGSRGQGELQEQAQSYCSMEIGAMT